MSTATRPALQETLFSPRQWAWLLLLVGGAVVAGMLVFGSATRGDPRVAHALWGGMLAAAATALGTAPVLLSQRLSERTRDTMLGFGAGVMLAASAFSLVVPALGAAESRGATPWEAAFLVGTAMLLGAAMMIAMDRWLPHEHFIKGPEGSAHRARQLRRAWLFVFAIALHNLPEGLAIGAAFAGPDAGAARALTTGIAIQDVPEGLVIAVALFASGYSRFVSVAIGSLSGLVEPLGAVIGAGVITLSAALLPWGLAFAAGAMLFVISHEMIPESHRSGHEGFATGGLMIGFVLMMALDTALA